MVSAHSATRVLSRRVALTVCPRRRSHSASVPVPLRLCPRVLPYSVSTPPPPQPVIKARESTSAPRRNDRVITESLLLPVAHRALRQGTRPIRNPAGLAPSRRR